MAEIIFCYNINMRQTQLIIFGLILVAFGAVNAAGQSATEDLTDESNAKTAPISKKENKRFDYHRNNFYYSSLKNARKNSASVKHFPPEKFDFSAAAPPRAQQANDDPPPISSDRPSFTTGPSIVSTEFKAQIEGGYTYTRSGGGKNHALGEILVRVPAAKAVELRFGAPSYQFQRGTGSRASGLGDASIGAKIKFASGDEETGLFKKPSAAVIVSTTLPVGAQDFSAEDPQPQIVLALSRGLANKFGLSSNVGYVRASDGGSNYNQFLGSVIVSRSLANRVSGFLEVYGLTRVEAATKASARYANGGLTFLVNNDAQLDARYGVGWGNNVSEPDYFFGFGYSQRF